MKWATIGRARVTPEAVADGNYHSRTEEIFSVALDEPRYVVTVELARTPDGEPEPVRVSIGARDGRLSLREARRFPLRRIVEAALAWAHEPLESRGPGWHEPTEGMRAAIRKLSLPRGRPKRGHSAQWYRELADAYKEYQRLGLSPVKEIAKRKGVSENTVHQWIHRMRHGPGQFLEKPPPRRGGNRG